MKIGTMGLLKSKWKPGDGDGNGNINDPKRPTSSRAMTLTRPFLLARQRSVYSTRRVGRVGTRSDEFKWLWCGECRRVEGQDDTHGCVVWWGVGAHLRERARESTCPEGPGKTCWSTWVGLGGSRSSFFHASPSFSHRLSPHVNSTLLCPSSFLSLSLCLSFFYYLFIIFLFLLASVKVTLFLFTIKGQFSHFNSQNTFHTLFSFLGFF